MKIIIIDSYVHFIYEDIVWYEICNFYIFLPPPLGGTYLKKNLKFVSGAPKIFFLKKTKKYLILYYFFLNFGKKKIQNF